MKFVTTMNIQLPESTMLRYIEDSSRAIVNRVIKLHQDDIYPATCADDLNDIMKKIGELHDKLPKILKMFEEVDNMNSHLKRSPTNG